MLYWTDGRSRPFQNRFTVGNLLHCELKYRCYADWSLKYLPHGKGQADETTLAEKKAVSAQIFQNQVVFNNAIEFLESQASSRR